MGQGNNWKSSRWFIFLIVTASLMYPLLSFAGPAYDGIVVLTQPTRDAFEARQGGDEWYNWVETRDGYGIFRNSATGVWEYYLPTAGAIGSASLATGGAVVGVDDPAALGIPKGLRPSRPSKSESLTVEGGAAGPAASGGLAAGPAGAPVLGARRLLVIGVDFADVPALYTPAQIQPLFFGAINSVADYYAKTSYGAVSISPASESSGTSNDGFVGWIRLNGNHPNPGANTGTANQQIAKDAIAAADAYVDFSQYDANSDGIIDPTELSIIVIVAGYERSYSAGFSPSVWGHQWSMWAVGYPVVDGKTIYQYAQFGERHADHLATIGIMAHELGHLMFTLPDLYDTDPSNGSSAGVGDFDLMGSGSWGAVAAANAGSAPTQLSAWSKEYLSWGAVTTLTSGSLVSFPKTDGNSASLFRINTQEPTQYFLVENRQFTGYDAGFQRVAGSMAHGGLVIYHIDTAKTGLWPGSNAVNADETDKGVDVEEANEGLLGYSMLDTQTASGHTDMFFFQGNVANFGNSTSPGAKLKNGSATPVSISDISVYGSTMTANVCTESIIYSLSPSNASYPVLGGGGVVNITASSANCGWKAVSSAWWLQINSGFSGSGSGTVVYTVIQNADGAPRTGYLTIAGQIFTVTQDAGIDTTPDHFSFVDQAGAALTTLVSSNIITVSGIAAPASISIAGGEYEINGSGLWTGGAGMVANGNTVRVRQMSSASYATTTSTTLTIGGVSDTFSVTTMEDAGLWHQVQDSATPSGRSFTSTSPTSWWYGQDSTGNYDTPGMANKGSFITASFAITAGQSLSFWSWEQTENFAGYDTRTVSISTNNGTTWSSVRNLSGTENQWYNVTIDLGAYSGQTVKFKFSFDTGDNYSNAFRGWYVDELAILGGVPDSCAAAREIAGATYTDTENPTLATIGADDPVVTCGNGSRNGSVWYKYSATQDGTLAIDTAGSNYDTILSAYTGNCGTLSSLACNDDTNGLQSYLSLPVTAGTTCYFMVSAYGVAGTGLTVNSTFTASGGGGCSAEPVSPTQNPIAASAINDLGEMVWSAFDAATGMTQIYSNTRGQLTMDYASHEKPSINNRGDVVWEQMGNIYGIISGQPTAVTSTGGAAHPWINDSQEIVWSKFDEQSGHGQVYSNRRGRLTTASTDLGEPAINNAADVVWTQVEQGWPQVYRLVNGNLTAEAITSGETVHVSPSISNAGEIVWAQGFTSNMRRIFSNVRGQLTFDGCPGDGGEQHNNPAVNSCGDITFVDEGGPMAVYRLGNASPCVSDTEPNDNLPQATLVSGNSTTVGMVQDPGDLEDWYKFTANAGDQIMVTVNWAPTISPNMLVVDLMDQFGGWLAGAPEPVSPKTITYTATYSGTYHVHLMAMAGSRVGYTLTLKVGIGGGTCADPIASGPNAQSASAINDLGEMVWSQYDPATGVNQIYSSTRGQLTFDAVWHDNLSMNNRGDVVWEQKFPWEQTGKIYGLISGQLLKVADDGALPSINDGQEIVWSQRNDGYLQVYSNRRGYLTNDPIDHWDAAINNIGDLVWTQFDWMTGSNQIYKLAAGETQPVQVTTTPSWHMGPSISNSGEIVWSEGTVPGPGAGARVYSSTRGQLSSAACPAGDDHFAPAVNSCGDVVFTSMVNNFGTVYRLGNASPCVSDTEPNNFLPEATLVSGNSTTMGMVQDPGDLEDWYKFTANAGDQIKVTVNWAPAVWPNELLVDFFDQYGGWLANAPEPGSPKTITYTAMQNGTYHVHLMAMPGSRIGYMLTVKVGIGGGTCADPVSPSANNQSTSAINDLGEIVWSQDDPGYYSGVNQIYSSTRGQLTFDAVWHGYPSMNNRGDVVWEQKHPWEQTGPIYGIISGQLIQVTTDGIQPSINDHQEIVWSQRNNGYLQVYSNRRGYLTNDPIDHWDAAINNIGDMVWTQFDWMTGSNQIYKLAVGETQPVQVTNTPSWHMGPSISNSGEIVWSEGPMPPGAGARVYSSTRGQLSSSACPAGDDHFAPAVNSCGDVVFTSMTNNFGTVYRLGNNSPCVSDTEPNNFLPQATLVSGNTTTTGMVDNATDVEDWYKFTANAGDQIKVTVNWAPTVWPNELIVDLFDQYGGWLAGASPGSPKTITYTATYSGTYHVHLMAIVGNKIGYSLSVKVGLGGGICADPVAPGPNAQSAAAINDLGEMVWSQNDPGFYSGVNQIYSSTRGQLTFDALWHDSLSMNNRGDVVWEQKFPWEQTGPIYGLISGQVLKVADDGALPSINDSQEIVWSQRNNGYLQIYSNRRGFLTNAPIDHWDAAINNIGDMVWTQFDWMTGSNQIYKLAVGETQPVQVTNTPGWHGGPSISNSGEIVWSEGPVPGPGAGARVYSSTRGQLSSSACPVGDDHFAPAVNSCGDVVFTSMANNVGTIYRLGNASPCVTDTEPNNYLPEATLVSGNSTTMGMVQDPGDLEDWYKFTANAGDPITVTVNWAPAVPPNMLMVDLMDQYGGWLAGAQPGSPKTITYTAVQSGTYHIHLMAMPGSRIGYTLTLKVGIGAGTCADPVSPSMNMQDYGSGVNDLGEVVWSESIQDGTSWSHQIISSTRGQLTSDPSEHRNPSVNNRGDVVWEQSSYDGYQWVTNIWGLISGQLRQLTFLSGNTFAYGPSINDHQEVVWSQQNGPSYQIYSNQRGWLTSDPVDHYEPGINNAGDVVWSQLGPGFYQIYELTAGSGAVVQLTNSARSHYYPSISNSGEVVWAEDSGNGTVRIYSSTRGQVTFDGCPSGMYHGLPSVNACGDVTFNAYGNTTQVYRLGNGAPCASDAEPNDFLPQATLVSGNSTTMGMVQDPGDWEDWYKFTANTGDQIKATVNWAPTIFPNMLLVDLMDQYGGWVAGAPETGSPKTITYTAMYTGTYHVHLQAMAGRIGYNLALNVIDTIPPTLTIDPVATPTRIDSQTISGVVESGAAVTVSINTAAVAGLVTYPTASIWSCTITGLVEGSNSITVSATDAAGNVSSREATITLDTVPPAVSIDPVVSPTKLNSQNVSGTRESNATMTLTVNTTAVVGEVTYPSSTTWNCIVSGLIEGTNGITVTATDLAGNSSIVTTSITVDTVAPVVTISSPAAGMTNVNAPLLSYIVDHGVVVVKVDGVSVTQRSGQNLNVLADGTHIVRVESTDAAGNTGFAEVTFVVDTLTPTVTVDPVATPTKVNMQTIAGGRENGAVITVSVDTSASVGPVIYPTGTTWSSTVTGLAEGINNIAITAKDGAQNITTIATSITYDSIAPAVTISSPVSGETNNKTPLLNYAITGGTLLMVSVDGVIVSKTSGQNLDALADGSHTVRVEAADAAGNTGFAQVTFIVDTVPPSVSINAVTTPTNVGSQTLTGTLEENAMVSAVVNTSASVGAISYPSATTWSCTVSNLATGSNAVTVTATDAAGNPAFAAADISFDGIAPTVSITSPGSTPTNDNTPLLTYSASDGSVVVKVDGVVVSRVSGDSLNTLIDGSHTVSVESTDAAGNTGFAQVAFIVDTAPPAVSIDPVITPTKNSSQTITGTRESGASVSVTVNTSAAVGAVSYPSATTWSCTISNLVRGTNVITVRAVDAAGNDATATATIKKT